MRFYCPVSLLVHVSICHGIISVLEGRVTDEKEICVIISCTKQYSVLINSLHLDNSYLFGDSSRVSYSWNVGFFPCFYLVVCILKHCGV